MLGHKINIYGSSYNIVVIVEVRCKLVQLTILIIPQAHSPSFSMYCTLHTGKVGCEPEDKNVL